MSAQPPAFVHDLNKCVGCDACVIACVNENRLEGGHFWRQVVTFNEDRQPALPVFHLSLACNHCLDAPCESGCPALAIARGPRTGAVLLDGQGCIGCRYCSWVCPYDAPRFDARRGVMGKCTLCNPRLLEGREPACTSQCPTGALKLGELGNQGPIDVAGFPEMGIRPAIRFVPLRGRGPDEASVAAAAFVGLPSAPAAAAGGVDAYRPSGGSPKLTLQSEWTLAVFTFVASVLVAWLGGSLAGGPRVPAVPFLAAGAFGLALSTLHLGRRERAWRAVLNWRRSWLSREVIAFPAFLALAAGHLLLASRLLGGVAAAVGLLALACTDRVYAVTAREKRAGLDDVALVATAAFLAGVLAGQPWLYLPASLVKLAAFVERLRLAGGTAGRVSLLPAIRLFLGLVSPAVAWLGAGTALFPLAVAGALAGEALDRAHFYATFDVVTPRRKMAAERRASAGHTGARAQ